MFEYKIGDWIAEFPHEYRMVCDGTTAVVIDDDRTALVLLSITNGGNICIERTYYAMICEIDAEKKKIVFRVTEDIA